MQWSFNAAEGKQLWEKKMEERKTEWQERTERWEKSAKKGFTGADAVRAPPPDKASVLAAYPTSRAQGIHMHILKGRIRVQKAELWALLKLLPKEEMELDILKELRQQHIREETTRKEAKDLVLEAEKRAREEENGKFQRNQDAMKQNIVEALEILSLEYTQPPEDKNDMHYGFYPFDCTFLNRDLCKEILGLLTSLRAFISTKRLDSKQPVGMSWRFSPRGEGVILHLAMITPVRK